MGFGAYIYKFNITQHVTWKSETGNPNVVNWSWVLKDECYRIRKWKVK